MEIIGEDFSIINFSNKPNSVQVLCKNINNSKLITGLPIKVSWTHQDQYSTIFTNKNGLATYELNTLWSNKKNQVLRFEIDYEYLKLDNHNHLNDYNKKIVETNVKTNGLKIFLNASINNLGNSYLSEELIKELKKYFNKEFFLEFINDKSVADLILDFKIDTIEKNVRKNINMPYIIFTTGSIFIKNNTTDSKNIISFDLPELKAGDFDDKILAGKKGIKEMIKFIKSNSLLDSN